MPGTHYARVVRFGLTMFVTDYSITATRLAVEAEQRGFESLVIPEHTHIPADRRTPYPGGGELPLEYSHTLDPFVALAAAAAVTERLRIGTGVCLVTERDPIVLAKEVASVDQLSGGRFLFGVGMGWNREEMANHGTDPAQRRSVLGERMAAMQAIWTQDEASFTGRHVRFERIWSWPKPRQRPWPPVLVGGAGPSFVDRVLAYGDEWMPINRGDDGRLASQITLLQRRAEEAGRGAVPVSLFGASGRPDQVDRYRAIGISRVILPLRSAPADDVLPTLDRYAKLLEGVD